MFGETRILLIATPTGKKGDGATSANSLLVIGEANDHPDKATYTFQWKGATDTGISLAEEPEYADLIGPDDGVIRLRLFVDDELVVLTLGEPAEIRGETTILCRYSGVPVFDGSKWTWSEEE